MTQLPDESVVSHSTRTFYFLVVLTGAVGAYVGYLTADRYVPFVEAVLGAAVIYLLGRNAGVIDGTHDREASEPIRLPRDLRHLVFSFVVSVIIYWAGAQVYNAGACLASLCAAAK